MVSQNHKMRYTLENKNAMYDAHYSTNIGSSSCKQDNPEGFGRVGIR